MTRLLRERSNEIRPGVEDSGPVAGGRWSPGQARPNALRGGAPRGMVHPDDRAVPIEEDQPAGARDQFGDESRSREA